MQAVIRARHVCVHAGLRCDGTCEMGMLQSEGDESDDGTTRGHVQVRWRSIGMQVNVRCELNS